MHKTKEEIIAGLTNVQLDILQVLDKWVWLEEKVHDPFVEPMQEFAEELDKMQSDIRDVLVQLKESPRQYIDLNRQGWVALTIYEAKELISSFNNLENANALY